MKKILFISIMLLGALNVAAQQPNVLPYGYAPKQMPPESIKAQGVGDKSNKFAAAICLNPEKDLAWKRLQGLNIYGVRCYVRDEYRNARNKWSYVNVSKNTPSNFVAQTFHNFTAGWNDVFFDEPVVIGNEPLYVGFQVYETKGSPYPALTYIDASVPGGCFINPQEKGWQSYDDRGTLYVFALVDSVEALSRLQHTAYMQNTTHPQTVAPADEFEGGVYLRNFGSETITEVEFTMQGKGDATPTARTLKLSTPIAPFDGNVYLTTLRAGLEQGTAVDYTLSVTKVNGEAAQAAMPGTTPLFVTQDNFTRYPLIEEFTSTPCTACPFMAYYLDVAMEKSPRPVYYVTHHSGFRYDEFTTDVDKAMEYFFEGNGSNPLVMYDRRILPGETKILFGASEASHEPYLEKINAAAALPAKASVEVKVEKSGRRVSTQVNGRVAHDLVSDELYLSAYLVEDGIGTASHPQQGLVESAKDPTAPADLLERFRHSGVILHNFSKNVLGDRLTVADDGTYSVSLSDVNIPSGSVESNCRIVAFVHRLNTSGIKNNEVLNAGGSPVIVPTGIADRLTADGDVHVFVDNSGRICTDNTSTRLAVYDLNGRRVNAAHALNPGTYVVRAQAQGRTSVRKIVVR